MTVIFCNIYQFSGISFQALHEYAAQRININNEVMRSDKTLLYHITRKMYVQ